MKRNFLFIGYESHLRDEIREFLKAREGEAFFTDASEDTIHIMNTRHFGTVVLKLQRLEDAAILKYININYKKTHVVVLPGRQMQEVIPALASGQFDLLREPFTLKELNKFMKVQEKYTRTKITTNDHL